MYTIKLRVVYAILEVWLNSNDNVGEELVIKATK